MSLPKRHMTNVEFVTYLMEHGSPMNQLFVIDALSKWSKKIADVPIEELREQFGENFLVSADGWQQSAIFIREAIKNRETDPRFRVVDHDMDYEEVDS